MDYWVNHFLKSIVEIQFHYFLILRTCKFYNYTSHDYYINNDLIFNEVVIQINFH